MLRRCLLVCFLDIEAEGGVILEVAVIVQLEDWVASVDLHRLHEEVTTVIILTFQ